MQDNINEVRLYIFVVLNDFSNDKQDDYNVQIDIGLISNDKVYTSQCFMARLGKLYVISKNNIFH